MTDSQERRPAAAEIQLEDVHFSYADRTRRFYALGGLSLTIRSGEFVCLLGPSGCGKSTLLHLLAGLRLPEEGSLRVHGVPVKGPVEGCALVFQSDSLFPWMTVRKNVVFCIRHSSRGLTGREAARKAEACLSAVGLAGDMEKYPCQLSGGMRQRAAIARAFAMDPDILLLDEPFGALDARMRSELQALLEDLWKSGGTRRKTVVFVTHDIDEALLLADRVIFMEPGRIAAEIPIGLPRPRKAHLGKPAYGEIRARLAGLYDREDQR